MPGARRRVFYFLAAEIQKVWVRQPAKASRNRSALTGSGLLLFDNSKAGKFTVRASVIFPKCVCASSRTAEDCGKLLWTITSFARVEHNCGRKGGLANCSRSVDTKACIADRTHPRGLERETVRGCMELRESERRRIRRELEARRIE